MMGNPGPGTIPPTKPQADNWVAYDAAAGTEELQAAAEAAAKRERQLAQASAADAEKLCELRRNLQDSLAR